MKKTLKTALALLMALCMVFALCACGQPAAQESAGQPGQPGQADDTVYTLRLGTFPGDTMTFMQQFAADVDAASNGRLKIEVMNFLTLGTPIDAVNMCKDGSQDFVTMSGTNYVGYEPRSAVVAIPLMVSDVNQAYELEKALLEVGCFSEWEGEVISMLLTDMQYIATATKEIKSAADFSGMIGRCQNANGIAVLQNLGASITTINTHEVYRSLETGVIDFSISSPTNMVSSAYQEVVDYVIDLPLYCDVNCLIMNKDSFAKLPADLQEVLKQCGVALEQSYQGWLADAEAAAIQTMKDAGVAFTACPDDVLKVIQDAAAPCLETYLTNLQKAGIDTDAFMKIVNEKLG